MSDERQPSTKGNGRRDDEATITLGSQRVEDTKEGMLKKETVLQVNFPLSAVSAAVKGVMGDADRQDKTDGATGGRDTAAARAANPTTTSLDEMMAHDGLESIAPSRQPSAPPSPQSSSYARRYFRPRQQQLYDSFFRFTRSIAHATTEFVEKEYRQPASKRPRWWRLDIPTREGEQRLPENTLERQIQSSHATRQFRLDAAKKRETLHHVVHSILTGKDIALPERLSADKEAVSYAQYMRNDKDLEETTNGLRDAMPKEVQDRIEDFFDIPKLIDQSASIYLHVLCPNRIILPEHGREGGEAIVHSRMILPFSHMATVLSTEKAWWSAKYLPMQHRRYSDDHAIREPIDAFFWRLRRRLRWDPTLFASTDDHVDEYATFQYLMHHAPGLIPLVEETADLFEAYRPGIGEGVHRGIKAAAKELHVNTQHLDESEIEKLLEETDTSVYRKETLDEIKAGGGSKLRTRGVSAMSVHQGVRTEDDLVIWFSYMTHELAVLAKTHQTMLINPLIGLRQESEETDDNLDRTVKHAERVHALLLRDQHGTYPVLNKEINHRTSRIVYPLAYEAYVLGSATAHEAAKDAANIIEKFSEFMPIPAEAHQRIRAYLNGHAGLGGEESALYGQLHQATFSKGASVIPANRWGAFFHDHRLATTIALGTLLVRNAWDHDRSGKLATFGRKLWSAFQTKAYLPFVIDLFTYRPEESHRRGYGKIDTDKLDASTYTLEFLSSNLAAGAQLNRRRHLLETKAGQYMLEDLLGAAAALREEMAAHPDNVRTKFATGLLFYHLGANNDSRERKIAMEHLLDVKGWIEYASKNQLEDTPLEDRVYIYQQMLSATEYYIAEMHRGEEMRHLHLLRHAYEQYRVRQGPTTIKASGSEYTEAGYGKIFLDIPEPQFNSDEELVHGHITTPLNFTYRRQVIEMLYRKGLGKNATTAIVKAYNDLTDIGDLLSPGDIVETYLINRIAHEHNAPTMPEPLRHAIMRNPYDSEARRRFLLYIDKGTVRKPATERPTRHDDEDVLGQRQALRFDRYAQ